MDTDDTGVRLLAAIARLNRWATRSADLPIPPAQGRLLVLVEQLGSARIGELAAADHCSQPTMTTQIQRLERAGLVSRRPDAADGRASVVELTEAGTVMVRKLRVSRARAVEPVLQQLTAQERAEIDRAARTIEHILQVAEQTGGHAG